MRNIKKIIMYIGIPLVFFSTVLVGCQEEDAIIVVDT